jgi:hypothetical protein
MTLTAPRNARRALAALAAFAAFLCAHAAPINVTTSDRSTVVVLDDATGALLAVGAPDGRLIALDAAGSGALLGFPAGAGCAPLPTPAEVGSAGGALHVARNFSCTPTSNPGSALVLVTDTFANDGAAIRWTSDFAVLSTSPPGLIFTVPLGAGLAPAAAEAGTPLALWSTWTRGCVQNAGEQVGMCLGSGAWREPFSALSLPAPVTLYRLGNLDFNSEIMKAIGPAVADSFTVPLATLMRASDDLGVTLLVSPRDPILDLLLRVENASIAFLRLFQRLDPGASAALSVTMYLRAHAADWRPALALYQDEFPEFVFPKNVDADVVDGLGGYSWQAPLNKSYADSVGFATNWELSGTFMPYDGLFAPYQEQWLNLGPINAGLPQYNVSFERINAFDESVQAAGLNSLTYFDVGNWGVSVNVKKNYPNVTCGARPGGEPAPCPTPEGSNAYLQLFLTDALLDSGWSLAGGAFSSSFSDWVGTTLMDPSSPFFEDLLNEQLSRRISNVAATQGIAIDRFDYTKYYSFKRDDGVSWVPQQGGEAYGPAQSLLLSHRHTYARLSDTLHSAGAKVMLGNCNLICRADLGGASFDGSFNEGAALNAVAWMGLKRPTILWTYSLSDSQEVLDKYFQQHVLMRVFPMAPMPGNDHSITDPSPAVLRAYEDYAPIFLALRHVVWALDCVRPVTVLGAPLTTPLTNLFYPRRLDAGSLLVPVVLGSASDASVVLRVVVPAGVTDMVASSLAPGAGSQWAPLGTVPVAGGSVTVAVPFVRGCALLLLQPAANATGRL